MCYNYDYESDHRYFKLMQATYQIYNYQVKIRIGAIHRLCVFTIKRENISYKAIHFKVKTIFQNVNQITNNTKMHSFIERIIVDEQNLIR